jgi:hypothetical protein
VPRLRSDAASAKPENRMTGKSALCQFMRTATNGCDAPNRSLVTSAAHDREEPKTA